MNKAGAVILAMGLFALGLFLQFERPSSLAARAVGFALMAAAAAVARSRATHADRSKQRNRRSSADSIGTLLGPPGWGLWTAGAALAAGALVSYSLMIESQAHGGRTVWPVYAFAGFVLAGAAVWSILGTKLMRWWGRR